MTDAPQRATAEPNAPDTILPDFFEALGNAQEATQEVDLFGAPSADPERWELLRLRQTVTALRLVEMIEVRGPHIRDALLAMEDMP
jgi:hypothetical protein